MNSDVSSRSTPEPSPPNVVDAPSPVAAEGLELPEPDPDNITVLSKKAPNTPILPWNHYDSPWDETEADTPEPAPATDGAVGEPDEVA